MARKSRKNTAVSVTPEYSFILYNTAIYIRLSVGDNKKRGNSVESQKTILENYIAVNPGLKLSEVYIDNGLSGQSFERPEFKRMIGDIESGKINCVIVKDLSRLGRNAIDSGYYIEKYFPSQKTRFISVNDNYDSSDSKNQNGSIIIPLKNMINEAYALDIAKKIKAQAHQSMKAGDYIGARPPYGYLKSPDNCHKLIVDEETAPVVKMIFEWAYNKDGYNTIVKKLNDLGIVTPGVDRKNKGFIDTPYHIGKGKWQTRSVSKILANEVYIGNMVQGKSQVINRQSFDVPENEWIRVNNTHEPIISEEMYRAVNAYRKEVANRYVDVKKNLYTENIFKGKVFCKHCGKSLHRHRSSRKTYVFYCLSNSRVAKGSCEYTESVRESNLRSVVAEILQKKAEVLVSNNISLLKADSANDDKHIKSKISALNQEIEKNRKYLKSLYENLVNGIIDNDDYSVMKADYEQKITSALNRIKQIEAEQRKNQVKTAHLKDLSRNVITADNLTAELIDRLIERIEVDSDKNIEITMRFEDEFESEVYAV